MAQAKTDTLPQLSTTYQPIEDYAVIGDLHTVTLVGKNGSIDRCCLPSFDSPSVFGALLDAQKGGFFRITPPETPGIGHKQLYLPETNTLITRFLTVDGVGEITDIMQVKPAGSSPTQITWDCMPRRSVPVEKRWATFSGLYASLIDYCLLSYRPGAQQAEGCGYEGDHKRSFLNTHTQISLCRCPVTVLHLCVIGNRFGNRALERHGSTAERSQP